MTEKIELRALSHDNFADFEKLTVGGKHGGCYCAFWHQKFNSVEEWHQREREAPEKNRECMRQRVDSGFHVGVLAYESGKLAGWISVSPVSEVFTGPGRVPALADKARTTACITCIALAPEFRGKGYQKLILKSLCEYGKKLGWEAIEGYPFDSEAVEKLGADVHWPGLIKGFTEAGFTRVAPHWLSNDQAPRSIYSIKL